MRAVQFQEYGDAEVLDVVEAGQPTAEQNRVVVRVHAAGINPGEAKIRSGALREVFPAAFPSGEGSDFAGTVTEVGAQVNEWSVGDEVLGWSEERSSHAEYVAVPADQLVAKPKELDWEVAGSLYVVGCTAYAAVAAVDPQRGETVVVTAASGGVGSIALQLVLLRGARVIAIASSRHEKWLESKGATVVHYGEGLGQRILEAAGGVPDAMLDFYPGGGYVDAGAALGIAPQRINTLDYAAAAAHGAASAGSAEGSRPEILAEIARLAAAGKLEVPISATYPIEEVRQAYAELEEGHTLGKIVLTFPNVHATV